MTQHNPNYKRIATEEAWVTKDILKRYAAMLEKGDHGDPGFENFWGFVAFSTSQRAQEIADRLQDIDAQRLAHMDAAGIDQAILSLTCPGVQLFDADTAVGLARDSNDELAEALRKHPDRFAGLCAVAPQAPEAACRELERAVTQLGMKGVIINSHTQGSYLDEERFWPILEACEALDVPLYLHPNTPPADMVQPFLPRCLDAAIYGFAAETGLHALRMIVGGVFDRYPRLKVVLGHLGEGLPYWLYRLDFVHQGIVKSNRSKGAQPLRKAPSDYLRENFWYSTSGMPWEPAITFVQHVIGEDRVMYAMDYPYQYLPQEVTAMDSLQISPATKRKFFQTNAEGLFKLNGSAQ